MQDLSLEFNLTWFLNTKIHLNLRYKVLKIDESPVTGLCLTAFQPLQTPRFTALFLSPNLPQVEWIVEFTRSEGKAWSSMMIL